MVDEMAGKILLAGLPPRGFTRVCLLRVAGPNTMRLGGDEQEPVAAREGRQLLATSPASMIDRTPEVRSSVGGLFLPFPLRINTVKENLSPRQVIYCILIRYCNRRYKNKIKVLFRSKTQNVNFL